VGGWGVGGGGGGGGGGGRGGGVGWVGVGGGGGGATSAWAAPAGVMSNLLSNSSHGPAPGQHPPALVAGTSPQQAGPQPLGGGDELVCRVSGAPYTT